MKRSVLLIISIWVFGFLFSASFFGCGNMNFLSDGTKILHTSDDKDTCEGPDCDKNDDEEIVIKDNPDGLHPLFNNELGSVISYAYMGAVDPDPTGLDACSDYDGDGISNENEIVSNAYVSDYPRIVTRISAPITMGIRIMESGKNVSHSETLEDKNLKETISNSMEDKHYNSAQQKTTPYVTKESMSNSEKMANSYGYSNSDSNKNAGSFGMNVGSEVGGEMFKVKLDFGMNTSFDMETSTSRSQNTSMENEYAKSTMSEKTVFKDVDYVDNLDRNGVEFSSETVQNISKNYRESEVVDKTEIIENNAGYVRATLYITNMTINMPIHISEIQCTLCFRTPAGEYLPVATKYLRNEDWSMFETEVYGGEESVKYVIDWNDLNTNEMRKALANGYVPQITVDSYKTSLVEDSNYNPGFNNLKIVEETAKARTATIRIVGSDMRELFRVAAFDVLKNDNNDNPYDNLTIDRQVSPGISLKKALFNILRDQIGDGELWEIDSEGQHLTVQDADLKWKPGVNSDSYSFTQTKGNSWNKFETEVKSYVDDRNLTHRIETIKRIDSLSKYNPFSKDDNPSYDSNELLSIDQMRKMKYWVVFHNGRYYEGDINDPIWAGERYEIVCMDMGDLNDRVVTYAYSYSPLQSGDATYLDTRWNAVSDSQGEFARSEYLGKVLPNEIINLEVKLLGSRFLFDEGSSQYGFGDPDVDDELNRYYNFEYTFNREEDSPEGIPGEFSYSASGGTNSLWLSIGESENAVKYRITFYPIPENGGQPQAGDIRTVYVTREEVNARQGMVVISSQTPGIGSIITGTDAGQDYRVTVTAIGNYPLDNGQVMEVTRKGKSIKNIASVYQPESNDQNQLPRPFGFTATGKTDSIDLNIMSSQNAEYYVVKITGPYDYTSTNTTTNTVAYAGYNKIIPTMPDLNSLDARNFDPGLYGVELFARNMYSTGEGIASSTGLVYIEVFYDKYSKQKRFAPRIGYSLYDLRAIDLEVNFNDGTGWYRLQPFDPYTTGIKQGDDDSHIIDCYYNSYMDYKNQKFYISFAAPKGEYGMPNVFFGGRDIADVYIRTIQKPKYRDTFWMVPDIDYNGDIAVYDNFNDADRYLSYLCSDSTGVDVTDLWINDDRTDASNIEDGVPDLYSAHIASSSNTDDYFFSPKEERLYSVKASATDEGQLQPPYRPDAPSFNAEVLGQNDIKVSEMTSSRETQCEFYYCQGAVNTTDIIHSAWEDSTGASWLDDVSTWQSIIKKPPLESFTIGGLKSGTTYTLLLAARNKYGLSVPATMQVTTMSLRPEQAGKPEIGVVGSSTDDMSNISVSMNSILITNLSAQNVNVATTGNYFTAYYKPSSKPGDDVNSAPWTAVNSAANQTSIVIPIAETAWTEFTVRIYSTNAAGRSVEFWQGTILPPTRLVALEAAKQVCNGYGMFRSDTFNLINIAGRKLRDGYEFNYGTFLTSIFDTSTSGSFSQGKCMRIVADGKNICSSSGYNLIPVAFNLSKPYSPPNAWVLIDPIRGFFIMPRPMFWAKAESLNQLNEPEIGGLYNPTYTTTKTTNSFIDVNSEGKFGNCVWSGYFGINAENATLNYNPFPETSNKPNFVRGIVSFWFLVEGWQRNNGNLTRTRGVIRFYLTSNTYFSAEMKDGTSPLCQLYVEGNKVGNDHLLTVPVHDISGPNYGGGKFNHVLIAWDMTHPFASGSNIRVYINGALVYSSGFTNNTTTSTINNFTQYLMAFGECYDTGEKNYPTYGIGRWDNLKIWIGNPFLAYSAQQIEEFVKMEYNNGNGRQDALHYIYGASNGYKPNLTGSGNGVGYYLLKQ